MNQPPARYEFRSFGQCFGEQDRRLRALAPCEQISESREIYFLGQLGIREHNVKLRNGKLELKRLRECREGMERWEPAGIWEFPVAMDVIAGLLQPLAAVEPQVALPAQVSLEELLRYVARADVALVRSDLFKRRFIFTAGACRAEVDELLVNGAAITSVALESEDLAAALALRTELLLDGYENVSYPLALARIAGLEHWHEEDAHG